MDVLNLEALSGFCGNNQRTLLFGGAIAMGFTFWISSGTSKTQKPKAPEMEVIDGDVKNYSLRLIQPGTKQTRFCGIPNGFNFFSLKAMWVLYFEMIAHMELKCVDFLNARKRDLKFEETGFTMMPFKEDFDMADWKTKEAQEVFKKQAEPILQKLFPGAEIVRWGGFLFRGGEGDNPPAVDGPHLDTYPDWEMVEELSDFSDYKGKGINDYDPETDDTKYDNDTIFIGFWKPINMANPVYDFPLAVMDKSTCDLKKDIVPFITEMSHIHDGQSVSFKNLGGQISHSEKQKWYYYPEMTTEEMIIFTHMAENVSGACPHTSFTHPSAPKDTEFDSRKSMETRVFLRYPKPSN